MGVTEPSSSSLFTRDDPSPVIVLNPGARSEVLVICDHAGRRIPARLGSLGLEETELSRHIAWDIGAECLSRLLGERLGATVVQQVYSRLVIDCNRAPDAHDSIVTISDGTTVPGNLDLSDADRAARLAEVHAPYHAAIAAELDRHPRKIVAVHSFTPVMRAFERPWQAGVLHLGNSALCDAVLAGLRAEGDLTVGDNEPYRMDNTDYSIPHHACGRGLDYVELEIRQDLIAEVAGQQEWAERLERVLRGAMAQLDRSLQT